MMEVTLGLISKYLRQYNGRPGAVNAIAADSEDLNDYEFTQFETDGTPWQEFMRVNKNKANSQGLKPNKSD